MNGGNANSSQLKVNLLDLKPVQSIETEPELPKPESYLQRAIKRLRSLTPVLFARIYLKEWKHDRRKCMSRLALDMLAGLTVGAMVVPQAMSFATVAGLQPVFGLYNALMGMIPYPFFGTCGMLVTGPTAVMSIMTKRAIPGNIDGDLVSQELRQFLSFILAIFAGILQVAVGGMGLGFLVNLVSEPVIQGFTSAAAFLIASTQFAALLGIPSCARADGGACTLVDAIANIDTHSDAINGATVIASGVSVLFLLVFKTLLRRTKHGWIGNFGPLILMLITIPTAYHLDYNSDGSSNTCVAKGSPPCAEGVPVVAGACCVDDNPFRRNEHGEYDYSENAKVYDKTWFWRQIGPISPGLPSFFLPFKQCTAPYLVTENRSISLSIWNQTRHFPAITCANERVRIDDNGTSFSAKAEVCTFNSPRANSSKMYNMSISEGKTHRQQQCVNFKDIKEVLYASITIAFIGYMESITIGKTVLHRKGAGESTIRPSNELVALGACNLMCGFLQGFPVTGSFSRTTVNADAGATTSFSLLFCALVIVISLEALTPTLAYMPKFVLGAIVVESIRKLIDIATPIYLWRSDRRDLLVHMVTFFVVVFVGVEDGIIIGIALGWAFNLMNVQAPNCKIWNLENNNPAPKLKRRSTVCELRRDPSRVTSKVAAHHSNHIAQLDIRHDLDFATSFKVREGVQDLLASCTPAVVILNLSGTNRIDSTGAHILHSITTLCKDANVAYLLLAGVTQRTFRKLRRMAKEKPGYQKVWEWDTLQTTTRVELTNSEATMVIFETLENALAFSNSEGLTPRDVPVQVEVHRHESLSTGTGLSENESETDSQPKGTRRVSFGA